MAWDDEYFQSRCGKATASKFKDVMMAKTTAGYKNYQAEIVAERLTGKPTESYTSKDMQWGIDNEPKARETYEEINGLEVEVPKLVIDHPTLMAGASPDGLVGEKGLIEIKCPTSANHIQTIIKGEVPSQHKPQIQGQLWITGRPWCDFISFDPRLDDKNAIFIKRVYRDEEYINKLSKSVTIFLHEVDQLIKRLEK